MHVESKTFPLVRSLVLGAVGLFLAWQVIATTYAAYLANLDPQAALQLNAGSSRALLALAQSKLDKELGGGIVAPLSRASLLAGGADARDQAPGNLGRLGDWAKVADAAAGPQAQAKAIAVAPAIDQMPPVRAALTPAEQAAAAEVRALATAALVADPQSAWAYRILGQLASQAGGDVEAERFMRAAAHHSLRESIAVFWLMRRAIDMRAYDQAADRIDTLLRTHPQLREAVVPSAVQMAETDAGNEALKELMARNPPWRAGLFSGLVPAARDLRTPLLLLLHLKTTPSPPTNGEIKTYLNYLLEKKNYDLAYNTWLQFLPDDQLAGTGFLYNGRFANALSGLAFDWTITAKSGVIADIVSLPDIKDGRALLVEFRTGQADFPGVTQTVVLQPGSYLVRGRAKGTLVGRRGLKWRVACLEQPSRRLGESQMFVGMMPAWQTFAFPVAVTRGDAPCDAQILTLELDARSASERLVSGSMWFTDLEIVRAEAAEAAPK